MNVDEALYQLKQNIKMHELENTTSNQNEREKALLDYITNLETIEQQYSAILSENAELENKITNLEQENERLKDEIYSTNQVVNELLDIKSRNEKAIEYIKMHKYPTPYGFSEDDLDKNTLINILTGGNEE